jgi:hypothetical protein
MDFLAMIEGSGIFLGYLLAAIYIAAAFLFTVVKVGRLVGVLPERGGSGTPFNEFLANFD